MAQAGRRRAPLRARGPPVRAPDRAAAAEWRRLRPVFAPVRAPLLLSCAEARAAASQSVGLSRVVRSRRGGRYQGRPHSSRILAHAGLVANPLPLSRMQAPCQRNSSWQLRARPAWPRGCRQRLRPLYAAAAAPPALGSAAVTRPTKTPTALLPPVPIPQRPHGASAICDDAALLRARAPASTTPHSQAASGSHRKPVLNPTWLRNDNFLLTG